MKKQNILAFVLSFSMIVGAGMSAFADQTPAPDETTTQTVEEPAGSEQPTDPGQTGDSQQTPAPDQTNDSNQTTDPAITDQNQTSGPETAGQTFIDMPDNWSTEALVKAVENGLLTGYDVNGQKKIKPDGLLTRAEMATIMNKAFNATEKADMTGVTDVAEGKWYIDHMAVAVQMESLAKDTKMRPDDKITRQEAFTVLAKVFKLEDSQDYAKLNTFSDTDSISEYAKDRIAALVNANYIAGSNGKIKPQSNITRAEFAAIMNNIVKQYVNAEGEVTQVVEQGNVVVNTANVTLKDATVNGNLILADGIGTGEVTLDNVTVTGTVVVRGGGENSVHIIGDSQIENMVVNNLNNKVRIHTADTVVIGNLKASKEVILDGSFKNIVLEAEGTTVIAAQNTVIDHANLSAAGTVIQGEGTVKNAEINSNNSQVNTNNTQITVAEGVTGSSSGSTALEGGSTHTSASDTSGQTPFDPDKTPVVTAPVIGMAASENPVTVAAQKGFAENQNGMLTEAFEDTGLKVVSTLTKGSEDYSNVRLVIVAEDGSDLSGLQLIAKDSNNNYFNIVNSGWGPLAGFELITSSTEVSIIAKTAGTYSFKVQLVDCGNQYSVIAESEVCTVIAE